jgi:uncharacterized glyoxalase superfamily protein PhnB
MVKNRSAPPAPIVPMLLYEDVARGIDWLCQAFGFTERLRMTRNGVVSHAQLEFGGGAITLGQPGGKYQSPARHGIVCQMILVQVPNVDEHFARAKAAGAQLLGEPTEQVFGERSYEAVDLEGHRWTFSQSIADVAPETWGAVVRR